MQPNNQAPQPYNMPPAGGQGMYPVPTQGPLGPAPAPMPSSSRRKPVGLIISLVITFVLLLGTLGFAVWAVSGMQHYKNDSDAISADAVKAANEELSAQKDKEFAEKEKSPFKTYLGPAAYGALSLTYPKTWSAFVTEKPSGTVVDGYMHPNVVPGIDSGTAFALRFQVLDKSYSSESKRFQGLAKSGKVTISPYRPAKQPQILGMRVDGQINTGQQDSMVIFPLRDKTVEVSTQATDFLADFNGTILNNLNFQP